MPKLSLAHAYKHEPPAKTNAFRHFSTITADAFGEVNDAI